MVILGDILSKCDLRGQHINFDHATTDLKALKCCFQQTRARIWTNQLTVRVLRVTVLWHQVQVVGAVLHIGGRLRTKENKHGGEMFSCSGDFVQTNYTRTAHIQTQTHTKNQPLKHVN